jgi:hypothetical protein
MLRQINTAYIAFAFAATCLIYILLFATSLTFVDISFSFPLGLVWFGVGQSQSGEL